MKKLNNLIVPLMILISVSFLTSCEKNPEDARNNETDLQAEKATVEVMISGETSHFDVVNIDIQELELYSDVEGWITIPLAKPGVCSLSGSGNGNDLMLGVAKVNSGKISMLRMIYGDNNTIVVNGISYPLTILINPASGIEMNYEAELEAGKVVRLWIDIEAVQSVYSTGDGKYFLKPYFRLFSEASSGSISGSVFPAKALPVVGVYNNTDSETPVMLAVPDAAGHFLIRGIHPGNYEVIFKARASGYTDVVLKNVIVSKSKLTELDAVYLGSPFSDTDDNTEKP